MDAKQPDPSSNSKSDPPPQPDPFTTGEALLARAKSVSQRIANRVRELTQDTQTDTPDEPTDEHRPLPS